MRYEELLDRVEERAGLEVGDAERTLFAVLQALADRLTGDEDWDLLAQLPARVKRRVTITKAPLRMSRDEFVERVARDLGVSEEDARKRIRAVFATLREAVTWGELEDVILQLDPEYADLFA